MNELIKEHNDLIDLPLRNFTANEIDILMAICYRCQNKKTNEVTLTFDEIKELSDFKSKNKEEFIESVKKTNRKLMSLNFEIGDEKKFIQFVLFPLFEVDVNKGTLRVKVNEPFAYLLNDLTGNYTSLELQESSKLKSSYSKQLYKKLRKYRQTGWWQCSLEEFREYFDIPKSYKQSDIDKRVIYPVLEELTLYFEGLKCEKIYKKSNSGKGRPAVDGLKFTFKIQPQKENALASDRFIHTGRICSVCGREFIEIPTNDKTRVFYGHKNADRDETGCDLIYTSIAELDAQAPHQEEVKVSDEVGQARSENKKKLSNLLDNLFK